MPACLGAPLVAVPFIRLLSADEQWEEPMSGGVSGPSAAPPAECVRPLMGRGGAVPTACAAGTAATAKGDRGAAPVPCMGMAVGCHAFCWSGPDPCGCCGPAAESGGCCCNATSAAACAGAAATAVGGSGCGGAAAATAAAGFEGDATNALALFASCWALKHGHKAPSIRLAQAMRCGVGSSSPGSAG